MCRDAEVRVLIPQKLTGAAPMPDGTFILISGDADGSALLPDDLAGFEARTSTNLLDWAPLSAAFVLTNGSLLMLDPQATNYPTRFYRIREQ